MKAAVRILVAWGVSAVGVATHAQSPQPSAPPSNGPTPLSGDPSPEEPPALLLADTSRIPVVTISWPTRQGRATKLTAPRPYRSAADKAPMGKNIDAYLALGGTRLERGLGNPDGATIRCGLYKADAKQLFFENLAENAQITIELSGIWMNQPVVPDPSTGLIHLKYALGDLAECGIDASGRNLFVTANPEDPLGKTVTDGSGKLGYLDGGPNHGSATAKIQPDGSLTITFQFPYHLLRHTKDPYQRTNPGGFFEPWHFHVEMEVIKASAANKSQTESP